MADRTSLGGGQNVEEARMQGRLAARELQQVRFALRSDQDVHQRLDLFQAPLARPAHRRVGEADGATEIAGLVNLDDGQARVLLVVGAEPAVVGTAVLGRGQGLQRTVARLQPVALGFPVGEIVRDQGLLDPMFAAALQVVDRAVLGDDLGRDQLQAVLTQARGLAEEQIGRALASGPARRVGRGRTRSIHMRSAPGRSAGTGPAPPAA